LSKTSTIIIITDTTRSKIITVTVTVTVTVIRDPSLLVLSQLASFLVLLVIWHRR
jgi:hypothetical protein